MIVTKTLLLINTFYHFKIHNGELMVEIERTAEAVLRKFNLHMFQRNYGESFARKNGKKMLVYQPVVTV
jgi:hypothetical protein